MFVDRVHLLVQAGHGGNGCDSYYRRMDKKIVPNGGDGGHGGSVIFRADPNAQGLASFRFRQHVTAENGGNGGATLKRGKNGKDLIIRVPVGTRISDRVKNFLIRDLSRTGEEVVVCQGGRGGNGNHGGKVARQGERGAALDLELSLLLRADVFLVGLPSSGKSKLLNVLTHSHAKEGAYPFTTKEPEIGMLDLDIHEPLSLCELPSLYKASKEGRGMGTDFLKHLEHAKLILYMLDPLSDFAGSLQEGLDLLRQSVKDFSKDFLHIPQAAAVNKMDLPEAEEKIRKQKWDPSMPVFYLSAQTGEGLGKLKDYLKENIRFKKAAV